MTAEASARNDGRFPCPAPGCIYTMESAGSVPAHVAMRHPEVPMDTVAPRRGAVPTTDPMSQRPVRASASAGETARDAASSEPGVPAAAIAPSSPAILAEIPLDLVDVGSNVRVTVAEVEELAASIAEHGVLQPVKVDPAGPDGRYRLLWGQRRVLASRVAGRTTILAIVGAETTAAARPIEQLVENLHRADLNPIDRAQAMRAVVDGGVSQAELARKLGIAPSTVSNDLRILTLAEPVLERIRTGEISASHGKAMASLPPKQQKALAERIVGARLSSKDLERDLEWKRQEAENDEAKANRTEKVLPKAIAALEAAKVPEKAAVYVSASDYSTDRNAIKAAVKAAGWALTDAYPHDRGKQANCDCTAVRLELDGRAPKVVPACTDDRHRDRQRNVDHQLEEEARKAYETRLVAVQREIERQLRAAGLHPLVLELLDKAVGAYRDGRTAAERDVVAGFALAVVQTWRVREAITPELLGELGLEVPA